MRVLRHRMHGKRRARQRQENNRNELEPNYASHEVTSMWRLSVYKLSPPTPTITAAPSS